MSGSSKSDLKLLTDLAKKLGIKVKFLSTEVVEDLGLLSAIKIGRTGKHVNTNDFLEKLSK